MRKGMLIAGVAVLVLVGAGAWIIADRLSAARRLGWRPEPAGPAAAGAAVGAGPATPLAPTDPLLGFSRYLPPDCEDYGAVLQAGRIWKAIAGSRAFGRIADSPLVKAAMAEARREFDPDKLPPEGRRWLDLLAAAFGSEIAVALPRGSTARAIGLVEAAALSAAVFAPRPHPPGTPMAQLLGRKLAPFVEAWKGAIAGVGIPSVVVAARVRDEGAFNALIEKTFAEGWSGFRSSLDRGMPPSARKALESAFGPTKVGGVPLWRLRLAAADFLDDRTAQALVRDLKAGKDEKDASLAALRRLTLDVHVGFLGEYLVLAVSSDDRLIGSIVDRFEGRAKDTLAASPAFAGVRGKTTADTISVSWGDSEDFLAKMRDVLPLIERALDPELVLLAGGPPAILPTLDLLRDEIAAEVSGCPIRSEEIIDVGPDLRRLSRREWAADRPPAGAGRLAVPAIVPATAAGFYATRDGSLEGVWAQLRARIRTAVEMEKSQRGSGGPAGEAGAKVLAALDGKIAPSLRGEAGFVLGPSAAVAIPGPRGPGRLRVPAIALVFESTDAGRAIEGVREILGAIREMAGAGGPLAARIDLVRRDVDGIEVHAFENPAGKLEGFEPHLAVVGKRWLVLATSLALTRGLEETAAGRAPALAPGEEAAALLDPAAVEVFFLDGGRFAAALGETADDACAAVAAGGGAPPAEVERVKALARDVIAAIGCFRSQVSCLRRDGRAEVLESRSRIVDVEDR